VKIAQVAPLYESVPPKLYGGTERIIHYLTEELLRQGHEVALYASGDSTTLAELRAIVPRSLRLHPEGGDPLALHLVMLEQVFRDASEFDIIHFHLDYLHFPYARRDCVPHIATQHGRLDILDLQLIYREYIEMPLVSISNAQREPLPWASWQATVYNGIPWDFYRFQERPGTYLAFLGRMSPEKRPDRAIDIAQRVGIPIKLAAKLDKVDRDYFEARVRPRLHEPGVEFIGEIGEPEKEQFLGEALALLFPIDWPEPFGIVMIEAMACGTPVVAFPGGSVREIVQDGVTGFVVSSMDEALTAVKRLELVDRRHCRRAFEQSFSAERMTQNHLAVYNRVLHQYAADLSREPALN
jgi:glycosyltransferase involved in cell wall biosynthesis